MVLRQRKRSKTPVTGHQPGVKRTAQIDYRTAGQHNKCNTYGLQLTIGLKKGPRSSSDTVTATDLTFSVCVEYSSNSSPFVNISALTTLSKHSSMAIMADRIKLSSGESSTAVRNS